VTALGRSAARSKLWARSGCCHDELIDNEDCFQSPRFIFAGFIFAGFIFAGFISLGSFSWGLVEMADTGKDGGGVATFG
jgi:hypothetical protein